MHSDQVNQVNLAAIHGLFTRWRLNSCSQDLQTMSFTKASWSSLYWALPSLFCHKPLLSSHSLHFSTDLYYVLVITFISKNVTTQTVTTTIQQTYGKVYLPAKSSVNPGVYWSCQLQLTPLFFPLRQIWIVLKYSSRISCSCSLRKGCQGWR